MGDASSDAALLERIRRNEPGAFDSFVGRYGSRIFGFGMRVCGEREDARDVAQDTLLQAFRSLKTLEQPAALRSWLYRVAANACLMRRRRRRSEAARTVSLDELMARAAATGAPEIPDVAELPDDAALRGELRRRVREAVLDLPAHYRIVIVLRDMEQLSTAETAQALDLPESTVKMRLHRARLMVRERLSGGGAGSDGAGAPS